MPTFVSGQRLHLAVQRLGDSGVHKRLCEYLVLKRVAIINARTMALPLRDPDLHATERPKNAGYIVLSTQNRDLETAIDDVMRWNVGDNRLSEDGENPYLNVFGTAEHDDRGYRVAKYLSNGIADTVAGWRDIVTLADGARPREIRLRDVSADTLRRFLLKRGGPRPRLEDVAAWYFRCRDITEFAGGGDYEGTFAELSRRLIFDFGLQATEIDTIFDLTLSPSEPT